MRKNCFVFIFLMAALLLFSGKVFAQENFFGASPEVVTATSTVTAEATTPLSGEAVPLPTTEARTIVTIEAISSLSLSNEVVLNTNEATIVNLTPVKLEEGASYKGVPWGADFADFLAFKGVIGNLGPYSAAFIGSSDDNDIAVLLGVPVSAKEVSAGQRVLFEYLPKKFASYYYEPDDTFYIFYNGKFALAFSRINERNFDLYRDTFYKKYEKTGSFAKRYDLGDKKTYLLQASIFEKGKTVAFLIKSQFNNGKTITFSSKLIFTCHELLNTIAKELQAEQAAGKQFESEKEKQDLEKDLKKIE